MGSPQVFVASGLPAYIIIIKRIGKLRACLNFAQHYFERCFRGYFSADMRSVAGYVTNGSGKRDRKQSQKRLNKIL